MWSSVVKLEPGATTSQELYNNGADVKQVAVLQYTQGTPYAAKC